MKGRGIVLLLIVAGLASLAACGSARSLELKRLEPYSKAVLIPGKGLGDLELGKTKLGWFTENIGNGLPSVSVTDEAAAIELEFLDGEASFLFIISGACKELTGAPRRRLVLGRDVIAFLKLNPACRDIALSSISVAAKAESFGETFFKGTTDLGAQLWSTESELYRLHGKPRSGPGGMVAGEADSDDFERLQYPSGISFYFFRGRAPTGDEVRSGRTLPPERLKEIEESASEAAKNRVVKRMTIFIPESN